MRGSLIQWPSVRENSSQFEFDKRFKQGPRLLLLVAMCGGVAWVAASGGWLFALAGAGVLLLVLFDNGGQ